MAWDHYEVVVEERRLKYYRVHAQSEKHARSLFTKNVRNLIKGDDVITAPTLTVVIKNIRRLPRGLEGN